MPHVLWIGGPPGSGKTTIATRLMRRHGLRLYSTDTHTWTHRDRALAAGNGAAATWESLPPDQRADQPPEELLAMSLYYERGAMVLDDVRALPESPLVVAEGSVIRPATVPPDASAVWLLPSRAMQERQLTGRDGRTNTLYRLMLDLIEDEVQSAGVPTVAVAEGEGVAETLAAVEDVFSNDLAAGPTAGSVRERCDLLREANLAHVEQVRAFYRRRSDEGDADPVERTFVCECGNRACEAEVRATVADVAGGPAVAPGHHDRGGSP